MLKACILCVTSREWYLTSVVFLPPPTSVTLANHEQTNKLQLGVSLQNICQGHQKQEKSEKMLQSGGA